MAIRIQKAFQGPGGAVTVAAEWTVKEWKVLALGNRVVAQLRVIPTEPEQEFLLSTGWGLIQRNFRIHPDDIDQLRSEASSKEPALRVNERRRYIKPPKGETAAQKKLRMKMAEKVPALPGLDRSY